MKNNNPFKIAGLALFAALSFGQTNLAKASEISRLEVQDEVAPNNYLNLTSMCSNDPTISRRWRVRNNTASPIAFTWDVYGTSQTGAGVAAPGDNFFETVTVPSSPNTTRIFWTVGSESYNKVKASGGATCEPVVAEGCFGVEVSYYNQGLTKLGTAVNPERSITSKVLGAPDGQSPVANAPVQNFYSLGFGGTIEIRFAGPIANGPGNDIKIWESSASPNAEQAEILVSQDGLGYTSVGIISQGGEVDFASAFSDYIQFIKIVDVSNPANFSNNQISDGFDVDAVECIHGSYSIPPSCYAEEVVSFNQKKQNDGSTVSVGRSNPLKALYAPENNDTENFVSLGFGGDITLKFGSPIHNGPGDDVRVIESTFGNQSCARYPETIRAYASQDGCHFVWIGDGCQDTDFDLGADLGWAQYIKLVDISPIGATYTGTPIADAYDVDGIMCLNGYEENPVPAALVSGYAAHVENYSPALRKNGTPITPARTNPLNSLGAPQGTDVINFVSLGFGGSLTLKFDYVIFDNPAANDIRIVETSFGNPSCAGYSEKVMVEGSLDNITWIPLTVTDICLDGEVDINSAGVIQYIRLTDHSPASSFSGSADGYDVDGLVVINDCSNNDAAQRIVDNVTTANEVATAEVFPNPFSGSTNVEITTGDLDNKVTIRVVNFLGQQVYSQTMNVASSSKFMQTVDMSNFSNGVYFLTIETTSTKETVKLIKN